VRTSSLANLARTKKAASVLPDAALANAFENGLEREIHASPNHAKVVLWPVHKIPAEITDPANVRS
jgi:hypothetical protein